MRNVSFKYIFKLYVYINQIPKKNQNEKVRAVMDVSMICETQCSSSKQTINRDDLICKITYVAMSKAYYENKYTHLQSYRIKYTDHLFLCVINHLFTNCLRTKFILCLKFLLSRFRLIKFQALLFKHRNEIYLNSSFNSLPFIQKVKDLTEDLMSHRNALERNFKCLVQN